jgi:hypothetical protein
VLLLDINYIIRFQIPRHGKMSALLLKLPEMRLSGAQPPVTANSI